MHIRWHGLELPSKVEVETETLTSTYGKFFVEPFERGFGTTIGNSLRRVLLSSLEGSAVCQLKISGAQHEFSSIEGVLEDVTEIVLNVKSLVIKNHSRSINPDDAGQTKVITIVKNTAGPITGADVQTDQDLEIVNKDLLIANLTADVEFRLEMVVKKGRGYIPANENSTSEQELGIIPVDAIYSPVTRVRYDIEETRVGQKTNYDKLTMEIWTNGSTTPEIAMVEAAKILRKHLNPFVQYSELGAQIHSRPQTPAGTDPKLEAKLNKTVAELNLSVRATNCLESENIASVRQLVGYNEDQLLEVRNFGETTLVEVQEKLTELGLRLGMRVPPAAQH